LCNIRSCIRLADGRRNGTWREFQRAEAASGRAIRECLTAAGPRGRSAPGAKQGVALLLSADSATGPKSGPSGGGNRPAATTPSRRGFLAPCPPGRGRGAERQPAQILNPKNEGHKLFGIAGIEMERRRLRDPLCSCLNRGEKWLRNRPLERPNPAWPTPVNAIRWPRNA
jgi:hypothetical protein